MAKQRSKAKKLQAESLHRSFKRSYKKDYRRETNLPSVMYHILASFKILFKNWRIFLPLLLIVVFLNIVLVGVMSQANYAKLQQTTEATNDGRFGLLLLSATTALGFSNESTGAAIVFDGLILVLTWLTTIFVLRYLLAKKKIKLRDALYNAMAPMVPTLVLLVIVAVECIPILLLVIAYAAAVQTDFLTMPFYALLFLGFAALMVTISAYLLTSSLMAFVAVSAPGMYPITALNAATDLMRGRRMNLILRLVALIFVVILIWVMIMMPLIMFDLAMKDFAWAAEIPFIPVLIMVMIGFTNIYVTTYLYLYYRWLLDN